MTQVPAPRRVGNAEIIHHEGYDETIVSPFVPAIRVVSNARLVFISGVTGAPVYHDHPHVAEVEASARQARRVDARHASTLSQ